MKHVACVPGTAFGAAGEGFMRCSYASSMDNLKEALRKNRGVCRRMQKIKLLALDIDGTLIADMGMKRRAPGYGGDRACAQREFL